MGARQAIGDAIGREEGPEVSVQEFSTIVTLKAANYGIKLSLDIGKEPLQSRASVGFIFEREGP
jgi:hypothetical protein